MPKLIIQRNTEWANKMRSFDIYLNGSRFCKIRDKEVLSFEVPEGDYEIVAKLDWCGSRPLFLSLKEGELKKIEIRGFQFSHLLFPLTIIVCSFYFVVYFKYGTNSLFLGTLMMVLFGYLFYYISIGRNEYLRIKEL